MFSAFKRIAKFLYATRTNGLNWAVGRIRLHLQPPQAHEQEAAVATEQRLPDDTLFAFYDLDLHPISYDVSIFVLCADLEREHRGLARLHVVFVPMTDPRTRPVPANYEAVVDLPSRMFRFENICLPFATMMPAAAGFTVCIDRTHGALMRRLAPHRFPSDGASPAHVEYSRAIFRHLEDRRGEYGFRASKQAMRYARQWLDQHVGDRKPIVITLRQYQVDPGRNSDPASWTAFARSLAGTEYCPVFVPDTDHAFDGSENWYREFPVFEAACWNVGMRMAVYELAYLNLFVNTGPAAICYLGSSCRYLFFKVHTPGIDLASIEFIEQQGYRRGETPPHATAFQKWVWEPDTFDVITREFEAICHRIESR